LRAFGVFFLFWYVWTKKNLATLLWVGTYFNPTTLSYNASVVKNYNTAVALCALKTKIFSSASKTH
jgi:hypothetical protein